MRERTAAEQRTARPRLRRLTASVLVVLIVMLPVLLAFARIDSVADQSEVELVAQAVFPDTATLNQPMRMFLRTAVPADAATRWEKDQQAITATARLAGMLALFGISALVYTLLLLVRGRATAMFGCLALCLLPPVAEHGFVLRAEQPSTLFGLLGVVLIAGFPLMLQDRRGGISAKLTQLSLMFVVGITFGVARSCQLGAWIYLAIPAGALLLSVMTLALMFPRAARGKPWLYWPVRAAARRYLPWMFLVLLSFAMTLMMLLWSKGTAFDTVTAVGLMPKSAWLSVPLLVFAVLGGVRMSLGVGLRIGRLRRVRPDSVLFLYVAVVLMQHFLARPELDRLPSAAALACLVADGVMTAAILGFGRVAKRRART